jgi:hypothetical protein
MSEDNVEELKAQIARLEAEKAQSAKKGKPGELTFKVSGKGAVSVYGLGRFPVTLYQEQWIRLLAVAEGIKTFIQENSADLKVKE